MPSTSISSNGRCPHGPTLQARLDVVRGLPRPGIQWQGYQVPATAWDAYNVATQVITHESTSADPLNNLLFGGAHMALNRAESLANEMFLAA